MINRKMRGARGLAVALLAMAQLGTPGFAETTAGKSDSLVATKTAWSVFADGTPKECWGVSKPKKTVVTLDGKEVTANRGEIALFITFRVGQTGGEIAYSAGYTFAEGSSVEVAIDGETYKMPILKDGFAWPASVDDDAKLLAAMQKGSDASLTGRSSKGKEVKDTFSLSGFTAAVTEAESQCK
jgi:invasion protein IalB